MLQALVLRDNNLTGTIPATLGNLTSLQLLDLSHNQLSGASQPGLAALGACAALRTLAVGGNPGLLGTWPDEWGALALLENLLADATGLAGEGWRGGGGLNCRW